MRLLEKCAVSETSQWFQKAIPNPVDKNRSTQLGVHLEEVAEMLKALVATNHTVQILLDSATDSLEALADTLKSLDNQVEIEDPLEFLDGLADQIVTAVGVAHMNSMDIVGALHEVNGSNFSKFDDEGNPIFNENKKIIKGPNYYKPDLNKFLPQPVQG